MAVFVFVFVYVFVYVYVYVYVISAFFTVSVLFSSGLETS